MAARQAAYDFWIGQKQLIGVLRQERISLRNYEALLEQTVFRNGSDADIRNTLLVFDNFYAQVNFCQSAELCDEALLDKYFCETAKLDALAYAPFYERLKDITRDGSIGAGLKSFAEWCVSTDGI